MANNFSNASIQVGTAPTTLYTCPAGATAVVFRLTMANVTAASDIFSTIYIVKASPASTRLMGNNLPIPAGSTLSFADSAIVLMPGDSIQLSSSDSNAMDAYASILEIT